MDQFSEINQLSLTLRDFKAILEVHDTVAQFFFFLFLITRETSCLASRQKRKIENNCAASNMFRCKLVVFIAW